MYLLCLEFSSLAFSVVFSILPPACDNAISSSFNINGSFWHQGLIVPGATDIQRFLTWLHGSRGRRGMWNTNVLIFQAWFTYTDIQQVLPWKRNSQKWHKVIPSFEGCNATTLSFLGHLLLLFFFLRVRHCSLSPEYCIETYQKLTLQSLSDCLLLKNEDRYSFYMLLTPRLPFSFSFALPFLQHILKHLLLQFSGALSSSHVRFLILSSSQKSWHKI